MNLIILFPQDSKNINHIHADHCDDMLIGEFKRFSKDGWSVDNHNFVTINLTSGKMNGNYQKNFDCFYLLGA